MIVFIGFFLCFADIYLLMALKSAKYEIIVEILLTGFGVNP